MRPTPPSAVIGVAVVLALVACTPGQNQQARSPGVLQSASPSPTASGTDHQIPSSGGSQEPAPPKVSALPPVKYAPMFPELTAKDGIHLSALVMGEGTRGVVLSHEQGYDVCSFLLLAKELVSDGYLVVVPEFRGHGASQAVGDAALSAEGSVISDELAAVGEARRRGGGNVGVRGSILWRCGLGGSGLARRACCCIGDGFVPDDVHETQLSAGGRKGDCPDADHRVEGGISGRDCPRQPANPRRFSSRSC